MAEAPWGDRACKSGRAVLLAPGILSPRKITVKAFAVLAVLAVLASLAPWRKRHLRY